MPSINQNDTNDLQTQKSISKDKNRKIKESTL
jgi:hypothetical protein